MPAWHVPTPCPALTGPATTPGLCCRGRWPRSPTHILRRPPGASACVGPLLQTPVTHGAAMSGTHQPRQHGSLTRPGDPRALTARHVWAGGSLRPPGRQPRRADLPGPGHVPQGSRSGGGSSPRLRTSRGGGQCPHVVPCSRTGIQRAPCARGGLQGTSQAATRVRSSRRGGSRRTARVGRAPLHLGRLPRAGRGQWPSSRSVGRGLRGAGGRRRGSRATGPRAGGRRPAPGARLGPRALSAVGRLRLGGPHGFHARVTHAEACGGMSGILRFLALVSR